MEKQTAPPPSKLLKQFEQTAPAASKLLPGFEQTARAVCRSSLLLLGVILANCSGEEQLLHRNPNSRAVRPEHLSRIKTQDRSSSS